MPSKPVTFKSMTAKSVAAKPVDSVEMMFARRRCTTHNHNFSDNNHHHNRGRGFEHSDATDSTAVIIADEVHGLRILTCVGSLHPISGR